jgi:putative peptide zinc metalloprotease protein
MTANDRVGVQVVDEQILQVEASLIDALAEQSALRVTTSQSGQLVLPSPSDTLDRYVNRGDVIAYVLPQKSPVIRVVVPEERIDLVRNHIRKISVRPSWNIHRRYTAELVRQVPAATTSIPSPALTIEGGGDVVLDPAAEYALTSLNPIFVLDLAIPDAPAVTAWAGARVHVRFDHGYESIGLKVWRSIRLLFLRELNV